MPVAELEDAPDLSSGSEKSVGSSPTGHIKEDFHGYD